MSAVAAASQLTTRPGDVPICVCGFDTWSNPWPGRPRHCLRCGGLHPEDPCRHVHCHAGTDLCADHEVPPQDSGRYRAGRVRDLRPATLTIGPPAACEAVTLVDLGDPKSARGPCGSITGWRLLGKPWCERCWWQTRAGADLLRELKAAIQP